MAKRLQGKSVIITGGGTGLGKATAEKMVKEGAMVAIVGIVAEEVDGAVKQLKQLNRLNHNTSNVLGITADISIATEMEAAVKQVAREFGRIDVLVNNAAVQIMGDLINMREEDITRLLDVNLKGAILASKYTLPIMQRQGAGSIIHVSSVLGMSGDADLAVYGATKGGLIALSKSMAVAYGPYGIRVNCICPGDVNTPMVKDYFDHQPDPAKARNEVAAHYPLRRIAEPAEVAAAIAYLASDEASFISGTELLVDGGLSAEVY